MIDVTPDPACLGSTITFEITGVQDDGGIQQVECFTKEEIAPAEPTFVWRITKPDGSRSFGTGSRASVVADQVGTYTCRFKARANRECEPPKIFRRGSVTLAFSATLTLDPSSIGARTAWTGMPPDLVFSAVTVTWTPPECVGSLDIVQIEGTDGYVPPDNAILGKESDILWHYTAFDEPITTLCPKKVKVWIAAMQGDEELTRESILVWPVHTQLTTGQSADFQKDYDYITWKYAAVLATTGGAFAGPPSISTNTCVPCGAGFPPPCVAACTHINDSVDFGTSTFADSENRAASIIGHELVHTTGTFPLLASECDAYTWELNHMQQTGISQCDVPYLVNVTQKNNCACFECP